MAIELLEVPSTDTKPSITLGMILKKARYGQVNANLFALQENEGPFVSDRLLSVANYVTTKVLPGLSADEIGWTLTAGSRTSSIGFTTTKHGPLKIEASDRHTFEQERARMAYSLDQYNNDVALPSSLDVGRVRTLSPSPVALFTIPCSHPSAREGVLYCNPSYYDAGDMHNNYEFILADTKKTIAQLRRYDPDMLEHADRKFAGDRVEDWLESASMEHPLDMGTWDRNVRDGGVTMSTGQAGMIRLVQELNLPFFPIATRKSWGKEVVSEVISEIGFLPGHVSNDLLMRPYKWPSIRL